MAGPQAPRYLLDAASGQPLNPGAREALLAAVDAGWADPARLYREARAASLLLGAARESIASHLGARPPEISFTSTPTHATHLAIAGRLAARSGPLAVSAVETSAVLRAGDLVESAGGQVRVIPVDATGRVGIDEALDAGRGASLLCLQAVNQEVGTTQPVEQVAAELDDVPILVDATHAVGWHEVPHGWGLLVAGAPQWGGPGGVGVLGVRTGVRWRPPGPADEREGGRVPGTPAVPLIVAAARGLEWATAHRAERVAAAHAFTTALRQEIPRRIPGGVVLGNDEHRAPHIAAASVLYADGESLVTGLDRRGYAVASGSACVSDTRRPSHVLSAMRALSQGNVRVSVPVDPGPPEVAAFMQALVDTVTEVRAALDAPI